MTEFSRSPRFLKGGLLPIDLNWFAILLSRTVLRFKPDAPSCKLMQCEPASTEGRVIT